MIIFKIAPYITGSRLFHQLGAPLRRTNALGFGRRRTRETKTKRKKTRFRIRPHVQGVPWWMGGKTKGPIRPRGFYFYPKTRKKRKQQRRLLGARISKRFRAANGLSFDSNYKLFFRRLVNCPRDGRYLPFIMCSNAQPRQKKPWRWADPSKFKVNALTSLHGRSHWRYDG